MTVADLQTRIDMRELIHWREFEAEFGPLTIQERMDAAIQAITYSIHASAGGTERPARFKPEWRSEPVVDMVAWLRLKAQGM